MEKVTGYVTGVNGNLVSARFSGSVRKNEVGFVKIGNDRLKGEVIRISGDAVSMQIYEMTNGIQVGDEVELTGELLSVELGPGLLTQVYDGLQNPLPKLAEQCGFFLERGVYLDPIPDKEWEFTPCVKPGDAVLAGDAVGSVPEGQFTHLIMAPFDLKDEGWRVKSVKEKGVYHVRSTVAVLENGAGEEKALSMVFSWPVKQPIRCYEERLRPDETLVTKIRCIDTFLPVAKGGTFCVPGPFGAGKTVLQHMEAKNADVDVVIVAACGERAGEVVEVLKEFREKASAVGVKQFVIQTHFQSPLEVTPEAREAIRKILSAGWLITNQLVYTVAASRRGHTTRLRQVLNSLGVVCYYTFSVKGFGENYTVFTPNSRSMQEQVEEKVYGRLTPEQAAELDDLLADGTDTAAKIRCFMRLPFLATDRSVLNLPAIGKSMTFRLVGITAEGKRILRFDHDRTRRHSPIIDRMGEIYIVENKSVAAYLRQLEKMGEDAEDYASIWGYTHGQTEPRFGLYVYPDFPFGVTDRVSNLELE